VVKKKITTASVELEHLKSSVVEMKQDVVMKVSNTSIELKCLMYEMKKGVLKTNIELVHSVASMKEEVTKVANVNVELARAIFKIKVSIQSMMKV
jgi:hypothetical protein